MNYIIAMFGALVMGVYLDAVKNKIGRISGEAELGYNFSAARWALLSALDVPGATGGKRGLGSSPKSARNTDASFGISFIQGTCRADFISAQ
ncbi:MAG: hypothetical protein QG656_1034 [Candidatus Hydrogenedentes bacterium]|nr:hypothetical protein [Candidatus Hydrogenedentota bacterium]